MKKNLIYLAILVILAILYFVLNSPNGKDNEKPKEVAKKLFLLKADEINTIEVNIENKKVICEKENGKWQITFPKRFAVDIKTINSFIKGFINIRASKSFTVKSINDFGLDKSKDFYKIKTKDLKEYLIIRGNKAPDGSSYYAKIDSSNKVYVLSQHDLGESGLSKSLKDFRDKDFLKLAENNIREVKSNNIYLIKDKDNWTVQNKDKPLDDSKIKEYINNISNVKAINFLDEKDKQKSISFNNKVLLLTIKTKAKLYKLLITEYNQKVYAKLDGDKVVYEVPSYIYSSLNKKEDFFFKKSLAKEKPNNNKKDFNTHDHK